MPSSLRSSFAAPSLRGGRIRRRNLAAGRSLLGVQDLHPGIVDEGFQDDRADSDFAQPQDAGCARRQAGTAREGKTCLHRSALVGAQEIECSVFEYPNRVPAAPCRGFARLLKLGAEALDRTLDLSPRGRGGADKCHADGLARQEDDLPVGLIPLGKLAAIATHDSLAQSRRLHDLAVQVDERNRLLGRCRGGSSYQQKHRDAGAPRSTSSVGRGHHHCVVAALPAVTRQVDEICFALTTIIGTPRSEESKKIAPTPFSRTKASVAVQLNPSAPRANATSRLSAPPFKVRRKVSVPSLNTTTPWPPPMDPNSRVRSSLIKFVCGLPWIVPRGVWNVRVHVR